MKRLIKESLVKSYYILIDVVNTSLGKYGNTRVQRRNWTTGLCSFSMAISLVLELFVERLLGNLQKKYLKVFQYVCA